MRRLAKFFGSILVFLLGAALCTVLALFVLGAFCVTYPVTRLSPRDAKLKAIMDLLLSIATAVQVLKPEQVKDIIEQATDEEPPDGESDGDSEREVAPTST